jgi:UDP-N-acetylmuramoyl-tripeptide--D-alanyl-D-alanine ligase
MKHWTAERIAEAAQARLLVPQPNADRTGPVRPAGPERTVIDSREAGADVLFAGLPGANVDGGAFAAEALAAGAWGVLVAPEHATAACSAATQAANHGFSAGPVVLVAEAPLAALQLLARAWRRELGAKVIGVTGSSGKTSTKDLLLAVLARDRRTVASRANRNTEIGLPLEILGAPAGTEVLVLEMGMRGAGQIAELAAIAEPDVAVITNVGRAHLELMGSVQAIAAAKAELIAALPEHGTAVIPAGEPLLVPYLREDVTTLTFGPGGDVCLAEARGERVEIDVGGTRMSLEFPLTQAHMRLNLVTAVAAAHAVGVTPRGRIEPVISAGRGERRQLPGCITLIDDSYNANPVSMRAALDDLVAGEQAGASTPRDRRVAVLGDMLELGPQAREFHLEAGRHADRIGVGLLVTVGPLAAAMADGFTREVHSVADADEAAGLVPALLREGDIVLVKGSRGVGLEVVCQALVAPVTA